MAKDSISSISDLSDAEIVRLVEVYQSAQGSYLRDPLEGSIVVVTGRPVVSPEASLFDDNPSSV